MDNNPYNPLLIPEAPSRSRKPFVHLLVAGILFLLGAAAAFMSFGMLMTSLLLMTDRDPNVSTLQLAILFSTWMLAGLCLLKASRDFWLGRVAAGVRATGFAILISPIPFLLFV